MITIQELRQALHLPPGEDSKLKALRSRVIALFESKTGKLWNKRTGHTLPLVHRETLAEREQPILIHAVNVSNVAINRFDTPGEAPGTAMDSSAFFGRQVGTKFFKLIPVDPERWGVFNDVTFDVGYESLPEELADIREALIAQAVFLHQREASEKVAVSTLSHKDGSSTSFRNDVPSFKEAVKEHKRKVF